MRLPVFALATVTSLSAGIVAQQLPQVPGALRSRVVLVPLDVRVIDANGEPVRDLRQSDFTIEEDGVAQTIAHFSTQEYAPLDPAKSTTPALRGMAGLEPVPQTHRTFVILLGRGRLDGPSKGLEATIDFVRTDLLPQDRVAVVAYGRATDLMTDREAIVRLLERYRERHKDIEALLDQFFDPDGLAAIYQTDHPPYMKPRIDELFAAPGLPVVRHIAVLEPSDVGEFERDRLATLDAFDRDDRSPEGGFLFDQSARDDLEQLHGAIEYLRYFEGEKHVVFVTEAGMRWVTRDQADRLAARAADARVTLSPVHVAGVETSWQWIGRSHVYMGPSPTQQDANADLRSIAAQTGGQASVYRYASQAFDRLNRATRFHYVLGYYPANAEWNGDKRSVRVSVRRDGARVLHRHSYYAREELVPYDRRAFLSHSRILAAGAYRLPLSDVRATVKASALAGRQSPWQTDVSLTIDPKTISFTQAGGRHQASLDVAIFLGGRNERQVGELRRRVDLNLEPSNYARMMRDGVAFNAKVDATAPVRYVKAVIYDFGADRLGSAVSQLR